MTPHTGVDLKGTAKFDSPEARALRLRAQAQARNLLNAIENGAFPGALILRAGEAAEATRNLAYLIMDEQKHP